MFLLRDFVWVFTVGILCFTDTQIHLRTELFGMCYKGSFNFHCCRSTLVKASYVYWKLPSSWDS